MRIMKNKLLSRSISLNLRHFDFYKYRKSEKERELLFDIKYNNFARANVVICPKPLPSPAESARA